MFGRDHLGKCGTKYKTMGSDQTAKVELEVMAWEGTGLSEAEQEKKKTIKFEFEDCPLGGSD